MAYWGQLTAVEKVPIELWDEIFKLAEAKEDRDGPSTANDTINRYIRPAVTFSQVSTKWRKIALSFPHLWTHISLEITNEGTVDHFPGPYLSQSFFERSQGLPLSVELAMHGLDVHTKRQCAAFDFIRHLFKNFQRWRTASIYLTFTDIHRILWGALDTGVKAQGPAFMLESIELRLGPQSADVEQGQGTIIFPSLLWRSAPALTRLSIIIGRVKLPKGMLSSLDIVVAPRWALRTKIPYGQLTHLLLDCGYDADMTWIEIHTVFSLAPKLVCAFFLGIKPFLQGQRRKIPPAHPILLQNLCHLYIQTHGDPVDSEIECRLDTNLIAPRLKTLAFVGDFIDWWQEAYSAFITQSKCKLEELYLAMPLIIIDLTDFVNCMQLSPGLKKVHLDLGYGELVNANTDLAACLAEWDGEATPSKFRICPGLQLLSIRNTRGPLTDFMREDDTNSFSEMLKTRSRPPDDSTGHLKTLALSSNVLEDEGVMAGLNLNVLHEDPWRLEMVENDTIVDAMKLWRRYCSDA